MSDCVRLHSLLTRLNFPILLFFTLSTLKYPLFDVMKTVSPRWLIIILVTDHSFFDRRNRLYNITSKISITRVSKLNPNFSQKRSFFRHFLHFQWFIESISSHYRRLLIGVVDWFLICCIGGGNLTAVVWSTVICQYIRNAQQIEQRPRRKGLCQEGDVNGRKALRDDENDGYENAYGNDADDESR